MPPTGPRESYKAKRGQLQVPVTGNRGTRLTRSGQWSGLSQEPTGGRWQGRVPNHGRGDIDYDQTASDRDCSKRSLPQPRSRPQIRQGSHHGPACPPRGVRVGTVLQGKTGMLSPEGRRRCWACKNQQTPTTPCPTARYSCNVVMSSTRINEILAVRIDRPLGIKARRTPKGRVRADSPSRCFRRNLRPRLGNVRLKPSRCTV